METEGGHIHREVKIRAWAVISEADIGGGGAKTIEKHSSIKKVLILLLN